MSGVRTAIFYSLKPHQLGFCGPQDKRKGILLRFLKGEDISGKKIRDILKLFVGAYSYYEIIARANKIKDPFNEKVVRAYWVGNELLEKIKEPKPHHSFHVLVRGSITGRIVLKGKLLDLCRIGWGEVKSKIKSPMPTGRQEKLKVKYQPLVGKKRLKLGQPTKKEIDWDKTLLSNIKIGDWVSFHWNQVVEVLNKKDIKNLEKYTRLTLKNLKS